MDFSQYTIEQLEAFQDEIAKEINAQRDAKRRSLRKDMERLAKEAGVSLDELFNEATAKPAKASKGSVAAKYRNPNDATQTWTGRGRQPLWVVAALAEGKLLSDLEI